MTSFESKTVRIAHSSERIFELLSDLSNLERFKGALNAPGNEKLKNYRLRQGRLSHRSEPHRIYHFQNHRSGTQ